MPQQWTKVISTDTLYPNLQIAFSQSLCRITTRRYPFTLLRQKVHRFKIRERKVPRSTDYIQSICLSISSCLSSVEGVRPVPKRQKGSEVAIQEMTLGGFSVSVVVTFSSSYIKPTTQNPFFASPPQHHNHRDHNIFQPQPRRKLLNPYPPICYQHTPIPKYLFYPSSASADLNTPSTPKPSLLIYPRENLIPPIYSRSPAYSQKSRC